MYFHLFALARYHSGDAYVVDIVLLLSKVLQQNIVLFFRQYPVQLINKGAL